MKVEPGHGGSLPASAPSTGGVGRRFTGDALWSVGANVVAGGLAIVVAGIATRLLGPEGFGVLSLVMTATGAAHTLVLAWIPSATVRFGREEVVRQGHLGTTAVLHTAAAAVLFALVAAAALAAAAPLDRFLGAAGTARAAALYLLAYFLFDHAVTLLQAGRVMRRSSLLYVADRLLALTVLLLVAVVVESPGWPAVLAAFAAGRLLSALCALPLLGPVWGRPRPSLEIIHRRLAWAWPLALGGATAVLLRWGNLALLRHLGALADVGLLGAGLLTVNILSVVTSSVEAVLVPHLTEIFAQGKDERIRRIFRSILPWIIFLFSSAVGLVACAVPPVIPWVFGEGFRAASDPTGVLIAGYGLMMGAIVWDAVLLATDDIRPRLVATLAAGLAALATGTVLIPPLGLAGAAVATALGPLLQALLLRGPAAARVGASHACDAFALVPPLAAVTLLAVRLVPPLLAYIPLVLLATAVFARVHPLRRDDLRHLVAMGVPPRLIGLA